MIDLLLNNPLLIMILILVIWFVSKYWYENRMSLMADNKSRMSFQNILSNFELDFSEKQNFLQSILYTILSGFAAFISLLIPFSLLNWIFDSNSLINEIFILLVAGFSIFWFRINISRNRFLAKINRTNGVRLRKIQDDLNIWESKLWKKVKHLESEISKINKVASENKFTDLTVNKLNKEVSTNELHIANLKKSLNEIREISDRIKEVFNWDYWLRKKIEENLEPDEINEFRNRTNTQNIYNEFFFDSPLDYVGYRNKKYSEIISNIRFLNRDIEKFMQTYSYSKIVSDYFNLLDSLKSSTNIKL
ncbi:MAG: hypothetical protein IPQ23_20220 [Cytophagaceae bacterium]|nr:hypothetical protein [Cytophagaceae bacterium]